MSSRNKTGFLLSGGPRKPAPDVELMPPSKFETSTTPDPWKELAAATNEIMCLRQQVDQHKHQQVSFPGSGDGSDMQRTTKSDCEKKAVERMTHLEQQLSHTETQYHRQLVKLQAEVKALQQAQGDKAIEVEKKHQLEKKELVRELDGVKATLKEKCEELEELQREHCRYMEESQQKHREKSSALEQCESQLAQLKKYISESEEVANSTYVWQKHTEQLKQQLKNMETEKVNLESGVQLLNIRLKSQMDIQHLQEQQIAQGTDKKKQSQLLQRWREKVFELLIQLQSSQITYEKDLSQWKYKFESTSEKLEKEKQENEVLRYYLKDKEAQLQMNHSKIEVLEKELSKAEQLAIHLDNKCREHQTTALSLCEFTQSVYEQFVLAEKPVKEVHSRLDSLNQRISFATGRVEMLQSQFLRKEALLKMQIEDTNNDPTHPETVNTNMVQDLASELQRVQQERDQLACQIKQDALSLHSRVQAAHQQVSDEINRVKLDNADLQQLLEDKEKELQAVISRVEKPGKEGSSPAEQLVSTTEQITQMQVDLSQARKEHSKALVLVRQLERQLERERDKSHTDFQQMENFYKQQLVQLEQQVSALSTDRNILMTNCQQEGLMFRPNREAPVEETVDALEELKHLSEEVLRDSDDTSVDDNHL